MSANGNGGNYAPLKQILSDSESEDDHKLENEVHIKATDSCNNLDFNSGLHSSKNYSLSDMDEFNTNVNTVESTMDNVSFLQSDVSNKMSFPRRCAFITSILVCIFTVVIFLWGIPCSEVGGCRNNEWQDKTTSWELPYDDIELSGSVQVVEGAIPNTKNLIFIYRGNHMKQENNNNDNVNGVLLIVGNSGKIGWYTRESRIPTQIKCHLIDVNRDNVKDCIVSGSEGLLAALNPISGTYYWYIHKHGKVFSNIATLDFPILVRDMDRDKVSDLLTVATIYPNTNHNSLLMISGATGNIIGEPIIIDDCLSVKLIRESETIQNLPFICKNSTTEAVRTMTLRTINRKLFKSDQSVNYTSTSTNTKKINLSLKNIGNTRDLFTNGPGKLIVENSGECPYSCRVSLKLLLERNGTTNICWEYSANHVYAMKPSSFSFSNSIRGFVLKL
ncbi:LOW QUALITY PROTEIN: protein FAM234B [Aphomia sociella]